MIVGRKPRILQVFHTAWQALFVLFLWDVAVTVFYFLSPFRAPALPLTIFGTALALFLGFRVNSAYQRWWEGRILWGAMVNASRSFARAVLSLLPAPEADALRSRLIERQIAYVHMLRRQLRRQDPADSLRRVLGAEAEQSVLDANNPANALLARSSMLLAEARAAGWIDTIQQTHVEGLLVDMSNAQGGMERIKNTPLPAQYRSFPSFFARLFCVLLPIGLVETLGVATPFGSAVAGFMFLAALSVGDDLVDPFADTIHDVPLTQITTMIEGDLLQMLGRAAPPRIEPVGGVLW